MTPLNRDVRFTPESGHSLSVSGCLLCAKSGLALPRFVQMAGTLGQKRTFLEVSVMSVAAAVRA
jgi:hypothetical protein